MSKQAHPWLPVSGRRWGLLMAAVLSVVTLLYAVAAPTASAGNFCTNVSLSPFGQGGDRCWGPAISGLNYGGVVTNERAGCVNIADGSNNLQGSWVCGSKGSSPGVAAEKWIPASEANFKGVIRNNNQSFSGTFSGRHNCWYGC